MKKRTLNLTTDLLNAVEQNEIKGGGDRSRTRRKTPGGKIKIVKIT